MYENIWVTKKEYSYLCFTLVLVTILLIMLEIDRTDAVHVSLSPHVTHLVPGLGLHVVRQDLVMNIALIIRASCDKVVTVTA